jgi:hypothetical protein
VREVASVAKGVAKGFDKVDPFQTVQGVKYPLRLFTKLIFLSIRNGCARLEHAWAIASCTSIEVLPSAPWD